MQDSCCSRCSWKSIKIQVDPGQRHDITQAPDLIRDAKNSSIIADKGYDSNAMLDQIRAQHCEPFIPPKSNREIPIEYDETLYEERHIVECFFSKIKQFRRMFSRFDKAIMNPIFRTTS